MDDQSRISFKGLIAILLIALGVLIGLLWGRFHPGALPSQSVIYKVHTPTPHMSSMFPHPQGPTKHRMVTAMGNDVQRILNVIEQVSQDFSTHSLNSMQHFAHPHFNPVMLLKEFMGNSDHGPRYFHHEVHIKPQRLGQSQIYRVDVLDAV